MAGVYTNATGPLTADRNLVLGVINFIGSVSVVVANSIVLLVITTCKELHHPTLWFIALMTFFDILFGVYYLVFIVPSAFLGHFVFSDYMIAPASQIRIALIMQNLLNVILVAMDRYIAIKWPLRYVHVVKMTTSIMVICFTFILTTVITIIIQASLPIAYYNAVTSVCLQDVTSASGLVTVMLTLILSFSVIIFCSYNIVSAVVKGHRSVSTMDEPPHTYMKSLIMVSLMLVLFMISYMPMVVITVSNKLLGRQWIPVAALHFLNYILNTGSFWNIVIYTTTYKYFREALLSVFCQSYLRRKRRSEIIKIHGRFVY